MPKRPRLADQLERAASKAFQRTRGIKLRFDADLEQIALMETTYGAAAVTADFAIWAQTADKDLRYPLKDYLKIVDERLGQVATEEDDSAVIEINKVVYEYINDVAPKAQIKKLLARYPAEDIIMAFRDFVCDMDKEKEKTAIKKFFADGGADAVISNLKGE
jgi:hypothetical protein